MSAGRDYPETEVHILFDAVAKRYGDVTVLEDFNLAVRRGEILTILGSSGCGKTTVLKLVNGLLRPDVGSVHIDGRDIAGADRIALRRTIGYAIQGVGLFPHMSVRENIGYVPMLLEMSAGDTARAVERCAALAGVGPELLDRSPTALSGGQRQRVGMARALAASPRILLMDEPFGALDGITRHILQESLRDVQAELGVTVLLVTHDVTEALTLGHRVLIMDKGRIEQVGAPEEIVRRPRTHFAARLVKTGREGCRGGTVAAGAAREGAPPSDSHDAGERPSRP